MNSKINTDEVIQTLANGAMTIGEAIKYFEIFPVVLRHGQWVVTEYGIECLVTPYSISKQRLNELDWISQLREKTWVNLDEFKSAFEAARVYHKADYDEMPVIPPPPEGTEEPLIDAYAADKLEHALLGIHDVYNSIKKYIPDDLPRPKGAPESFSAKEDGVLLPAYTAFAYAVDGFLACLNKMYILQQEEFSYQTLLNYSREQFKHWLSAVL